MPDKKSAQSASPSEDPELERRVKAIMEPGQAVTASVPAPVPAAKPAKPDELPPLDIFSDPKTAPALPVSLLKKIGIKAIGRTKAEAEPESPPAEPTVAQVANQVKASGSADAELAPEPSGQSVSLDDTVTDQAVDEIEVNDSDAVLAAADAAAGKQAAEVSKKAPKGAFKRLISSRWTWLAVLVVLAGLLAYPATRARLIGLVYKESVTVTVTDSKTATGVSDAIVQLGDTRAKTNADGKAVLKVPPGGALLTITKLYYKTFTAHESLSLHAAKPIAVKLVATGRQVPITVLDKITGKPLANAEIKILDTTAKTNAQGQATIALPTTTATDAATVSLTGYNTASPIIAVTSGVVAANTVNLVPAGQVYFLSNLSGTIDVVKANLDGSGRTTVLKGTGQEDPNTTGLLAARDWHDVVLRADRNGVPALYLINTSNDKVTQFDSGSGAIFTMIGWYGHLFVYDAVRPSVPVWEDGHETLKAYNADTGQLNQLDQDQAEGNSTAYAYQGFYNFFALNNLIVYNTQWYTYTAGGSAYNLSGKVDTVRGIEPAGQNKKDYQSVPASSLGYFQAVMTQPQDIDYSAYDYSSNTNTYYQFTYPTVTSVNNLPPSAFTTSYPTFLMSPDGSRAFWANVINEQNALFTGTASGGYPQQLDNLNGYNVYGWYSDNYVLVTLNNDELYIASARPSSANRAPLKISDYYRPAQTAPGFGYGYGGL